MFPPDFNPNSALDVGSR
jgi:hypothetical protein